MERVLVIGASGAIGSAMAAALARRGFDVITRSRSDDGFDITDAGSVADGLAGLTGLAGLFIATGGLQIGDHRPEKRLKDLTAEAMQAQFMLNTIGPALVLSHASRILRRDARAVCAVLSARVGSIGDNHKGGWLSYRAAKAAVNQVVRTASIELARSHPQAICVALHPGTVRSALTARYVGSHPAVDPPEAAENLLRVIAKLTPADTGQFVDWAGQAVPW